MPARPEKDRQPKTRNKEQAGKRSPATPRAARDVQTPRAARPARSERGKTVDPAGLNPAQREAVHTLQGPVLVIAGAGTGKTLTLVHRLAELVRSGVPAESILLLTFTRRAAGEMIARASALPGGGCERVAGGTFHSFANATLRRHGPAIGIPATFTILDQSDTFEILSGIRSDLELSKRGRGFPRRETIAAILSKAANKQTTIQEVLRKEYPQFRHEAAVLDKIGKLYTKYKEERLLLDFDDLLLRLLQLLETRPDVRERIARRYGQVMVDEYQDTNELQARITRALAGESGNVMVVGDDAQSIYAFRGACYRNLFDFREAFPRARLVTLQQNYRSTQPVLDVANALMAQMSRSFRKELFTRRRGGQKPLLVEAGDEKEQARYVAEEVERLRKTGVRLADIGVLFRASSHAFVFELELQSRDIPYVKYGGFKFFETAHIKDVLCYLRVVANPVDDLSLVRALMLCEGVGRAGARKMQQSLRRGPGSGSIADKLRGLELGGRKKNSVNELADLLQALERGAPAPAASLRRAVDFYLPNMKQRYDDWPRRERDLQQLVALCERYRSVESMLTELALEPPTSSSRDSLAAVQRRNADALVLSTMHSAKGLEWRSVFVIQAIDGCIPMVNTFTEDDEVDPEKLDEELRLFYVAVTRARDELQIVFPRDTARGYGYGWAEVSRFIDGVPESLLSPRKAAAGRGDGGTRRRRAYRSWLH
jgi:DNA helicase-2/ATP-dependent DNA helicase PcrA